MVDFETFYDTKGGYCLKTKERPKGLPVVQYVRDSRFYAHGVAYRFLNDERTHWVAGPHAIQAWVDSIDWANTVVVAHNVRFDGAILRWLFNARPPHAYMDTVGLAKAILGNNVSSYSLKRLAEYLGLPAKGDISCDGVKQPTAEQLTALAEYCKNDVELCKGIYEKLIGQFPVSQLWSLDWTIRAFLVPKLQLSEEVLKRGVQDEKKRREEAIKKSGVDKAVLSSNKQFAEFLVRRGIKFGTKTSVRTGQQIPAFSKTDDGLTQLKDIAPDLYAARIASKANLLETRGDALLAVARTGSFPFDVGFSGAVQTHRYSGGSGAGGNPQNFTRNSFLREAVCAPKGSSLIVGDFAAIELRLLAWLAKEPKLMSKIINDEDIYADFASIRYGRIITKADKNERHYGKESILGLGYGMGAKKFRDRIRTVIGMNISEEDAWKTVDLYRTTYFNVPKLWEQAGALLPFISTGQVGCLWFAPFIKVKKSALVLPSGLEIRYPNLRSITTPGPKGPRTEWVYDVYTKVYEAEATKLYGGKIIENICQALAGELTKSAIERAEKAGLLCVGQCHDEVIAIAPAEEAKNAVEILKGAMEQPPYWLPTIKLKAEVGIGSNWDNAKC